MIGDEPDKQRVKTGVVESLQCYFIRGDSLNFSLSKTVQKRKYINRDSIPCHGVCQDL